MKALPSIALLSALFLSCADDSPAVNAPSAPAAVAAEALVGSVRITWTDASDNEERFLLGRQELATVDSAPDPSALVVIAELTADQESYRDFDVVPGVHYAYGVAAENGGGKSAWTVAAGSVSPRATTSSVGCTLAAPTPDDLDGDGVPNAAETAGWTLRVDETGQGDITERTVTSDPMVADSDGDGLCDPIELRLRTDPRAADTDGDGLTDVEEIRTYGSSAINVDSDGDAGGNPAFFDGAELERYGTSPTLADTDGDGRSDFEEINQSSTDALLADLPKAHVRLEQAVQIELFLTLADGTTQEGQYSTALSRSTETASGWTTALATSTSLEVSNELSVGSNVGFPSGLAVSVGGNSSVTGGFVRNDGVSFERSSAESSATAYSSALSGTIARDETITGGTITARLAIDNEGTRTFQLDDLIVTALARNPDNPQSFKSIATLALPEEANNLVIGEGESRGPFLVQAQLSARDALDLLANPSGVFLAPASFNLVDRTGQAFEFSVGEATAARTAQLSFDFDGRRPPEVYNVATNVARVDGGAPAGLRLIDALTETLGLREGTDFAIAEGAGGPRVLTRLRDVEAIDGGGRSAGFWTVLAVENRSASVPVETRLTGAELDFEQLRLMPRDRVVLAFVADEDGDGLFSREERLYGTSDQLTDTDGDGISDFDEVRVGWPVSAPLRFYRDTPLVFGDPAAADVDGDGLDDVAERAAGTDPKNGDTDGDGELDGVDAEPLVSSLLRPYVLVVGSIGDERPLAVGADPDGNALVFGSITGADLDGDGEFSLSAESRFLASYDESGRRRWVLEFEDLAAGRPHASHAAFTEDGRTFLLLRLPDVGLALIEVQPDGTMAAPVPLFFAPANPGAVEYFNTLDVVSFIPSGGGQFVMTGAVLPNNFTAVHVFDTTGAVTATVFQTWFDNGLRSWYFADRLAVSRQGLWIAVRDGMASNGFAFDLSTPLPAVLRTFGDYRIAVNDADARWVVRPSGEVQFLQDGNVAFDAFTWQVPGPANASLLAFDLGPRDDLAVVTQRPDLQVDVRMLTATGAESSSATLPALGDVRVHAAARGVYVAGSATGGYANRPGYGVSDIVLIRNPADSF